MDKFDSIRRKHRNMGRKHMINLNCQSSNTSLLPSDFQLEDYKKIARDSEKRFLQFCFSNDEIPAQGFKINISATQLNYQVILDEVFDLCKSNLIDFNIYLIENNFLTIWQEKMIYGLVGNLLLSIRQAWMTSKKL